MGYNVIKGFSSSFPISLPPHKFVQVSWKMLCTTALHPLQLDLHPIPVTLHVLSMNQCGRVYKVKTMIHSLVSCNYREVLNSIVRCPFIRVNRSSNPHMVVDNGEECCCVSLWYNLHVPQSWPVGDVYHPKDPYFLGCSSTSVILQE